MNIWEDLTMACPQCGAASNEKCHGVNTVTPRIAIHENRDAANQSEYARRATLYPEMLAALKDILTNWKRCSITTNTPGGTKTLERLVDLIAKCEASQNEQT